MSETIRTVDDDGGRTSSTRGSTGGPATINPGWLDINWTFPTAYESAILGFDVIAYAGTNPEDGTKYFFQMQRVSPNVRRLVKSIVPTTTTSNVNASVRAIYA